MKYVKFLMALAIAVLVAGCGTVSSMTDSLSKSINSSTDDTAKKEAEQKKLITAQCDGNPIATLIVIESTAKEMMTTLGNVPPPADIVSVWNEKAGNCFKIGATSKGYDGQVRETKIAYAHYRAEISYGLPQTKNAGGAMGGVGGYGMGGGAMGAVGFSGKELTVTMRITDSREPDIIVRSFTKNVTATDTAISGGFITGMLGLGNIGGLAGSFGKMTPAGEMVTTGVLTVMNDAFDLLKQRGPMPLHAVEAQPAAPAASVAPAPAVESVTPVKKTNSKKPSKQVKTM